MNISKKPKVSVCVVTYNQENYIKQCLQSIVDQERDFEIEAIVSDDCSTDNTPNIVREFADKYDFITPVLREKNIGAFKNFVETHNMAKGEYVCHLDGDDVMLPDKLQLQAQYLADHLECNIVWHRVNCFNDEGAFSSGNMFNYYLYFQDGIVTFDDALAIGSIAPNSSSMYRRTARTTLCPNFQTLDLFYTWELLSTGCGKVLQNILGEYRVSASGSISKQSHKLLRKLNAHHAEYFFLKYPSKQKQIFLFATINFLVDLKNFRNTAWLFLGLALKTWSISALLKLPQHLKFVKAFKTPKLEPRIEKK